MKIGFIGTGNMGEAIIKGLASKNLHKIYANDVDKSRLNLIKEKYSVEICKDNIEIVKLSDIIIIAVKPHIIKEVIEEIRSNVSDKNLIISIAAGVKSMDIRSLFQKKIRIVRVMPNTPALVLEGATVIFQDKDILDDDVDAVKKIFDSIGKTFIIKDEQLMDIVTALSGSGPAYVFIFLEALSDGAVKMGLPRNIANSLAIQTLYGSAKIATETGLHFGELKDMVTSPGGTTMAAIQSLEDGRFRATVIKAIESATKRSRELSGG